MKYCEWLDEWMKFYVKPNVKKRTFDKYNYDILLYIIPYIGNTYLCDLGSFNIQRFLGEISNRGLSVNTINSVLSIVRSSLCQAEKAGLEINSSAKKIERLRIKEKSVECFSIAEQKTIEKFVIESEKNKLIGILISFYTGLRIGELLALKWDDIDFKNALLTVNKSCYDTYENGIYVKAISTPKTDSSFRIIPIPNSLLKYLKCAKKNSKSAYVVANGEKDISIRSYQRTFELILKKLSIPHKGFHAIRHTFATRALECGMDVKTLSEILGHKNSMITLNRYVHSMIEHKTAMMNKLGKLLN